MAEPLPARLAWAIEIWQPAATVTGVRDLHDGQSPWLIEGCWRTRPLEPDGGYTVEKRRCAEQPTQRSMDGARVLANAGREPTRHPRPAGERGLIHGGAWHGDIMSDGVHITA